MFINATQPESCAIVDGATIELSLLWEYQKERGAKNEIWSNAVFKYNSVADCYSSDCYSHRNLSVLSDN